ncbi:hypothetical protein CONPUDRAFT_159691 [Coniophora puteana RWD-64-598 SS2]|uniref:Uncharacterized protein n=1 Tax=Coniophora puteana (strain RWD-64-598) TaxID=741705 RepID=A0A5M3M6E7_CONPW|nr:uncharacterized protein CONPUDRAFT_159691 [Coniophora puteana RWD-64-598 SS2]EIW74919.1 hypothetical protein CONPUDRAFT_159691 [Coniophora puteana RWD-64-598 SS2]
MRKNVVARLNQESKSPLRSSVPIPVGSNPCILCPSTTAAAVVFATATILLVPAGICTTIDTLPPSRAIVYCTPNVPLPATQAAPPPPAATPTPGVPVPAPVSITPKTWALLATSKLVRVMVSILTARTTT